MATMTTTPTLGAPDGVTTSKRPTPRTLRERSAALLSAATAAVLGILPHVLHHAGSLAGAALLAGTAGSLLFGAIGLAASIPFLLRVHRRSNNWSVPAALLGLFAVVFSISTFVVGPAISGSGGGAQDNSATSQTRPSRPAPSGHDAHPH
jgi:hypothetical protein